VISFDLLLVLPTHPNAPQAAGSFDRLIRRLPVQFLPASKAIQSEGVQSVAQMIPEFWRVKKKSAESL
jgi:hypothetical protein